MAITWQFRDSVLVITLVGKYAFEEKIQAVTDAMGNPQFHLGTSLLIDSRKSEAKRSAEDVRAGAHWIASLVPQGISPRCAIVISSQIHQYGLARMLGIHLDLQGLILEIFTDFEEAMCWLTAKAAQANGN